MIEPLVYSLDKPIRPEDVQPLIAQTTWAAHRSLEQIQTMLDNTSVHVGAWQGPRLIGYGRAVTDDVYRAYIEDIIVDSKLWGQGIGHGIMEHLLERLAHVEEVTLNCQDHLITFYERIGFKRTTLNFLHIRRG